MIHYLAILNVINFMAVRAGTKRHIEKSLKTCLKTCTHAMGNAIIAPRELNGDT